MVTEMVDQPEQIRNATFYLIHFSIGHTPPSAIPGRYAMRLEGQENGYSSGIRYRGSIARLCEIPTEG